MFGASFLVPSRLLCNHPLPEVLRLESELNQAMTFAKQYNIQMQAVEQKRIVAKLQQVAHGTKLIRTYVSLSQTRILEQPRQLNGELEYTT